MTIYIRGFAITHDVVLAALREFDAQYPDPNDYDHWLQKKNYKYAIKYEGRVYPPKYILELITGLPARGFNGGEETNRVFKQLGFEVIDKPRRPRRR